MRCERTPFEADRTDKMISSYTLRNGGVCVDFSGFTPGTSVEGLGTVHPDLNIDAVGTAVAIRDGVEPAVYGAPNGGGSITNNGIDAVIDGFSDDVTQNANGAHEYTFTFTPGTTVEQFSLRMLDFGDWNPATPTATTHTVTITAYDGVTVIDTHILTYTSNGTSLPSTSPEYPGKDLYIIGDAIGADPDADPQEPGNFTFEVTGTGIDKVELIMNPSGRDPNVGFDNLCFTIEPECEPLETTLWAGAGQNNTDKGIDVGTVTVSNDSEYLYVTYEITEPDTYLDEVHLWVGTEMGDIPKKAVPGKFPYKDEELGFEVTVYEFEPIPLDEIEGDPGCEDMIYLAAHAVVDVVTYHDYMIDFESYQQYDEVMMESTPAGNVEFYMIDRTEVEDVEVGETADLSQVIDPYPYYPVIATEDPGVGLPADYPLIVAFTVNDAGPPKDTYRDDWVKDDNGTGAAGMLLTDPQDSTQTPLMWHAYSQLLAIAVDVSDIDNYYGIEFAGIDHDHGEYWYIMYFDSEDELLYKEEFGPGTSAGDGKAFPFSYDNPDVETIVLWGFMNQQENEIVGFAFDNFNITYTTTKRETAWGFGEHTFIDEGISRKWGWIFEYIICCDER
jgi:hypothetical protein